MTDTLVGAVISSPVPSPLHLWLTAATQIMCETVDACSQFNVWETDRYGAYGVVCVCGCRIYVYLGLPL